MKVVYDIQVESREDEYMSNLRTAAQLLSEATRPISYLAESIPIGMTSRLISMGLRN